MAIFCSAMAKPQIIAPVAAPLAYSAGLVSPYAAGYVTPYAAPYYAGYAAPYAYSAYTAPLLYR